MIDLPSSKNNKKVNDEVNLTQEMQSSMRQNLTKFMVKNKEEDNGVILLGKKD